MKILILGDVMGEPGRKLIEEYIPTLRHEYKLDFIIVNGENAAHGNGITEAIAKKWFNDLGINVITTGNHAFGVKGIASYFNTEPRLLRPANYPIGTPGNGYIKQHTNCGLEIMVINLMGRIYMPMCDDPFRCADNILNKEKADIVIVDMHAEASSEAQAMGHYLDGRATAVMGTHTHVPTLDAKILPNGTAYVTDIGMVGPYDGIIGMKKETSLSGFLKVNKDRFEIAKGDLQLHGILITINTINNNIAIKRIIKFL